MREYTTQNSTLELEHPLTQWRDSEVWSSLGAVRWYDLSGSVGPSSRPQSFASSCSQVQWSFWLPYPDGSANCGTTTLWAAGLCRASMSTKPARMAYLGLPTSSRGIQILQTPKSIICSTTLPCCAFSWPVRCIDSLVNGALIRETWSQGIRIFHRTSQLRPRHEAEQLGETVSDWNPAKWMMEVGNALGEPSKSSNISCLIASGTLTAESPARACPWILSCPHATGAVERRSCHRQASEISSIQVQEAGGG